MSRFVIGFAVGCVVASVVYVVLGVQDMLDARDAPAGVRWE